MRQLLFQKNVIIGAILSVALAGLGSLVGVFWLIDRWQNTPFVREFARIHTGMTVADVEKILGKGEKIGLEYVPHVSGGGHDRQAVEGREFYHWRSDRDEEIWTGVSDGFVVDKYMYKPSF